MTIPILDPVVELKRLYEQAFARSGLPYRSPSHRIAEQLAQTGQAAAYAEALWLVTRDTGWQSRAASLARNLRDRVNIDQSDIDAGDRAESKMRRYGLRGMP